MIGQFAFALLASALAVFMIWFGMPNKAGEQNAFMRNSVVQTLYPVAVMLVGVVAIAEFYYTVSK